MPHPLPIHGLHEVTRYTPATGPNPERKVGTIVNVLEAWAEGGNAWALVHWPDDSADVRTSPHLSLVVLSVERLGVRAHNGVKSMPALPDSHQAPRGEA